MRTFENRPSPEMTVVDDGRTPDANARALAAPARVPLVFPCSQAQKRFWFEESLHPGNQALNIAVRWQIDGELSDEHLSEAWRRIVHRHQTLRTSLVASDDDVVQLVEEHVDFAVTISDLRELGESEATAEAERIALEAARTPFDIAAAPLVRVGRVRLTETRSILLVTAHHTVCDGFSIGILASEMGRICADLQAGREPSLPPLVLDFGEYARWESDWFSEATLREETAYAKRLFDGFKHFELLTDRARPPIQGSNGSIATVLLDRDLTERLTTLAQSKGCTLFMLAYAALLVLLNRYSGETDITIGTQVVGRDAPELELVAGCFINTIALRADVDGDPSFVDLLERVREIVLEAFENSQFPLERLVELVNPARDLSRNSLFSVNVIFQRSFIENARYGAFALVDLPSRSAGSLYDLNFFMVERPEGWRVSCEYNTDLFDQSTVTGLLRCFEVLLRAVAADPVRRIQTLPLIDDAMRRTLVSGANRVEDYPRDRTFPDIVGERAAQTPDATAVVCGERRLTYAQLARASDALAAELLRRGCAPGGRIGVLLHRSTDLVVALLGVMKSGNAYVPLDPAYPRQRLTAIVEDARPSALVTRFGLEDRLPVNGSSIVLIDSLELTDDSGRATLPALEPDDAAYVIYTSGSTGTPKGVVVPHRALVNFLWSMAREPGMTADDTIVAVTTVSFDIAGLELYLPLVVGAKVVIAREEEIADGAELLRLLETSGATILQGTPVLWQLLVDAGWNGRPNLRVLCGGEALPRALADRLLERATDVWNMYGPTETTIWSSAVRVERGADRVFVGGPIANTQFYVLDERGELAAPGSPGELYIGGDGVAIGYFGNAEMTAQRFVPDVFSERPGARLYRTGDLVRARPGDRYEFLGRTDQQIKLRGFRIELGEIEFALGGHADVAEAVVAVRERDGGDKDIVAFVVPRTPNLRPAYDEPWFDELRAHVATTLPAYMLPATFVALDALPRLPNGKIDRRALPSPQARQSPKTSDVPMSHDEEIVAMLVNELLGRESIGIDDDIFARGFHSLLAVRLLSRVTTHFNVGLSLQALFLNPTVRTLAAEIDCLRDGDFTPRTLPPIVTLNPGGSRIPFFFLHSDIFSQGLYCKRLAAALGPSQTIHATAPHGTAGLPRLVTIRSMARDYVTRIRAIQPEGPYRLGGYCVSGLVAYEVARLLRAAGDVVDDVVLINASAMPTRALPFFDELIRRISVDARLGVRVREKLAYNLARLHAGLARGPRGAFAYAARQWRTILKRERSAEMMRLANPEPFQRKRGMPETENAFVHVAAGLTYHPEPYDGRVTLIWAIDQEFDASDPTVGWGGLAREVDVIPIEGDHVHVLHAGIGEFSRVLETVLSR